MAKKKTNIKKPKNIDDVKKIAKVLESNGEETKTIFDPVPPLAVPVLKEKTAPGLPYALRRELEEITKNTGITFDLNAPIEELERICNNANHPPNSWRHRWE